jgi:phosphatidylglycerol:prolipoprotein diacylglycerol transferase
MSPVAFTVFGYPIRWYGLAYLLTFTLSSILGKKVVKYKQNLSVKDIERFINYAVIGVVLGGRLGYFLFYEPFSMEFFEVWKGGMSFHGGVIGMIFSTIIYCILYKKPILELSDIICLCVPIGCFFGRIGNFINKEISGKYSIFLQIEHPVVLYEALLEGLVLFLILINQVKNGGIKNNGKITALFFIFYALFRMFCEIFRMPDGIIYGISTGQFLSIPMLVFGIILYKNYDKIR